MYENPGGTMAPLPPAADAHVSKEKFRVRKTFLSEKRRGTLNTEVL